MLVCVLCALSVNGKVVGIQSLEQNGSVGGVKIVRGTILKF